MSLGWIRFVFVLLIAITLFFYFLWVILNARPFIDVWPLEGILWETIAILTVILIFSLASFRKEAFVAVSLTIQVFLVVTIPVLKYSNALNIVGPWDSVAHFSFAKWIVVNGYVDTAGHIFYADQYGFHPGNGVIPATLSLVTSISLSWSMNFLLIIIYLTYMLLLLATLNTVGTDRDGGNAVKSLWLLAVFTLTVYLPVYYGGVELGYVYAAGYLYALIRQLSRDEVTSVRTMLILFLVFLGLLATHLSTSIIIVTYMLVTSLILLIVDGRIVRGRISRSVVVLTLLIVATFAAYEIYVDVSLFGVTFSGALHRLYSLYVRELEVASRAVEAIGLTFLDLVQHLISFYAKNITILGVIFVHTVALWAKWRYLNPREKIIALLLFASYPTWVIGWAGVGSFLAGGRSLGLISFLLALSLALTYEKLYKILIKNGSILLPLILIVFGFVVNFGLPLMPTIRAGEDVYTYSVFSQGGFSDYALHPVAYTSSYSADTSPRFLCLQPYITFGLCDLMWQTPKIPKHGFIAPRVTSPETILELIKNYLDRYVVVPQPLRDRLLPGPIGYHNLYERSYRFLIEKARALIYNNGNYVLFLS